MMTLQKIGNEEFAGGREKDGRCHNPGSPRPARISLGRPPRPIGENELPVPLHPRVAWERAAEALADFRARMKAAKLKAEHVTGAIVSIEVSDPDQPHVLLLEEEGIAPETLQRKAFEELSRPDVIALGMIFRQFDQKDKRQSTFPYQFMGLNQRGIAGAGKAAELQVNLGEQLKNAN